MADLESEQKFQELRLRAAQEKDPFKLAVLLSEVAALARQQDAAINPEAVPGPDSGEKDEKKATPEKPITSDGQADAMPLLRSGTRKYSRAKSERYLKLAEAALRDNDSNTMATKASLGDDKDDPTAA